MGDSSCTKTANKVKEGTIESFEKYSVCFLSDEGWNSLLYLTNPLLLEQRLRVALQLIKLRVNSVLQTFIHLA